MSWYRLALFLLFLLDRIYNLRSLVAGRASLGGGFYGVDCISKGSNIY